MALKLNLKKDELISVAVEIGLVIPSKAKIIDLKKLIESSAVYKNDIEFVRSLVENALEKSKQEAEKNKREAEKYKREAEIQLEKIKLSQIEKQLELEKVRKESEKNSQSLESEPSSITDKLESLVKSIKTLTIQVPVRSESFNLFFHSLEKAFQIKSVPDELKAEILLNILGERVNNLLTYARKLPSENYVQFASRLSATFDYYCQLRKVNEFRSLCDLIISDKIFETLDRDTMNHIATKQGETYFKPQQLGRECDVNLSARGKVSNDLMSRNPGSGVKTDGRNRLQTVSTWRQERNSSNVFVAETKPNCILWQIEGSVEANSQSQFVATGFEKGRLKNVFLSTVRAFVKNKYSQWVEVRCLLDVGSQSCLCTRACAEKLQLKMEKINTVVSCVNDASMVVKNCVKTSVANKAKTFESELMLLVVNKITDLIPNKVIDVDVNVSEFVPLADDKFNIPDRIDMLLGAEIFYELLKPGKFYCDNSHLVLQNTVFGYVVSGSVDQVTENRVHCGLIVDDDLNKTLKKFWEIEGVHIEPKVDTEVSLCEDHFVPTHRRNCEGEVKEDVFESEVLSVIAKLYDPLGFLGPVIAKAKVFLQQLWQCKLDWDDVLPNSIANEWREFVTTLKCIEEVKINRFIMADNNVRIVLQGFADASEAAYGAVVYLQCFLHNGAAKVSILARKSRVAPIRVISIPRLKLCACVLLAQLVKKIHSTLRLNISDIVLHTDSTIALAWLNTPANRLKTFVANLVAKVQELTEGFQWNHVPSVLNPADLVSRGLRACDLQI
ncbi:integrase catalytic domain-containing protein [Trichonephila clavipes]|nr:integrase catalytic domain-containing protein [Trichonephila clavipes]